ncbi:MAG TPA: cyclic nucleotide-binding domain-containing protein [Ramlibacter sp.]|nr:cyclic nucleotide-binding domain-containing protein [Ramlibacter sp.]
MGSPKLEQEMRAAGLEVLGPCQRLSEWPGLLEGSPMLENFTPAEVDLLGSLMLRVKAGPAQRLIAEGDATDWMMLLLRGTVDVGKRLGPDADREERGDHTRLAVLRTGAVLGEMSMFDGEPRYASCWALSEVEAAVLGRDAVTHLVKMRPEIGAKLLLKLTQLLAQRLRNTSAQLVKVLRRQAGA